MDLILVSDNTSPKMWKHGEYVDNPKTFMLSSIGAPKLPLGVLVLFCIFSPYELEISCNAFGHKAGKIMDGCTFPDTVKSYPEAHSLFFQVVVEVLQRFYILELQKPQIPRNKWFSHALKR